LQKHERYGRVGFDLLSRQKISVTKAILGGEVEIQTLEGPRTIILKPGAGHDQQHALKGYGFKKRDKEERGDMFVTFEITIPTVLTSEQKKAIESFAQLETSTASPKKDRM